jgi:hypothetical protein
MKDNREWHHGYIAEEVYELGLEELVGYDSEKNPASVNYSLVGVFALEIIKDQQKVIEQMQKRLNDLEERIKSHG